MFVPIVVLGFVSDCYCSGNLLMLGAHFVKLTALNSKIAKNLSAKGV